MCTFGSQNGNVSDDCAGNNQIYCDCNYFRNSQTPVNKYCDITAHSLTSLWKVFKVGQINQKRPLIPASPQSLGASWSAPGTSAFDCCCFLFPPAVLWVFLPLFWLSFSSSCISKASDLTALHPTTQHPYIFSTGRVPGSLAPPPVYLQQEEYKREWALQRERGFF